MTYGTVRDVALVRHGHCCALGLGPTVRVLFPLVAAGARGASRASVWMLGLMISSAGRRRHHWLAVLFGARFQLRGVRSFAWHLWFQRLHELAAQALLGLTVGRCRWWTDLIRDHLKILGESLAHRIYCEQVILCCLSRRAELSS